MFPDDKCVSNVCMCASVVVFNRIWIGLADLAVEGEFRWGSGALLEWTHWRSIQPDNAGDQDCVAAVRNDGLRWADDKCLRQATAALICQHVPGR